MHPEIKIVSHLEWKIYNKSDFCPFEGLGSVKQETKTFTYFNKELLLKQGKSRGVLCIFKVNLFKRGSMAREDKISLSIIKERN